MKSEENCRGWKTESGHEVNEHFIKNIGKCHICTNDFIENSFVNWHPDPKFKGCHEECRKRYTIPDEPEERKHGDEKFDQEDDDYPEEREFTKYGQPIWNRRDESLLEEMWRVGKSIKEIADALTRELPYGYKRSEGAVIARIKKLGIVEKTGRSLQEAKYPRWTDNDDLMLKEMYGDWHIVPEIMEALGRSEGAIRARVKNKEIDKVTGRPIPPTEKQFRWLEKLGYVGSKPTTVDKAWELTEVWYKKPTSPQLESELREAGYDGPTPETNRETQEKINEMVWINDPITETQTRKIWQICALVSEEVGELPTNKWKAHLLIDSLIEKAEKMGIDVPKLIPKRKSTYNKKKRLTPNYDDDEDETHEDHFYCEFCKGESECDEDCLCDSCREAKADDEYDDDEDDDEWDETHSSHETDDDKRGD